MVLAKQHAKIKEPYSRAHTPWQIQAVLERGKSHRTIGNFENFTKNVFAKKHAKMKEAYSRTHTPWQIQAVLETGKSHRTIGNFKIFDQFLAPQTPSTSRTLPSDRTGYTPRPKYLPGLGGPNSLKLEHYYIITASF